MLIKLMEGVLGFKEIADQMDALLQQLNTGQHPDTLFITCSDSRVIPSLITQAKPGDLFVHRNIGNIIPPYPSRASEAATIEYALSELDIKDIIICGHSQCGAMKGLLTPGIDKKLPAVGAWLSHSHSVLKTMHEDGTELIADPAKKLTVATQKNILLQIEHLKTYPLIAKKLASNELTIHGWLYDVRTGKVQIYEAEKSAFISLETALDVAIEKRKNKIVALTAMNYLERISQPKNTKELQALLQLFTHLEENLEPIWHKIRETAHQELWNELGVFYDNAFDKNFLSLLESGAQIKLPDLKKFQKNIIESKGYHQFCSQVIHASFFLPAPKTYTLKSEYCPDLINDSSSLRIFK